jgi:hypothetical protein
MLAGSRQRWLLVVLLLDAALRDKGAEMSGWDDSRLLVMECSAHCGGAIETKHDVIAFAVIVA